MTSKTWTRKQFLELTVSFAGATAVLGSFGCPSDDTGDDGAGSSGDDGTTGDPPATGEESTGDPPATTSGPGESSGGPNDSSGGSLCGTGADADIGMNHGHSLFVPIADIEAGVEVMYDIQGSSMHPHMITLTPDDLAMLLAGMSVVVLSTEDAGHTHEVTVSC